MVRQYERGFDKVDIALASLQTPKHELMRRQQSSEHTLNEMKSYLNRLELDISSLSIIHVAGTKGKGSTCAFVESILRRYGVTTGFFSSPHLISIKERVRINGKVLPDEIFLRYFWAVFDKLQQTQERDENFASMPAFFRFFTLLAFYIFVTKKIDVVVLEVGVGGTLDPTNVIDAPVAAGLTSIGFDHMSSLGSTLTEIATQKAGIIKHGSLVFTCPQNEAVLDVFHNACRQHGSKLQIIPPLSQDIPLGLNGNHQRQNAALAASLSLAWLRQRGLEHEESLKNNQYSLPSNVLHGVQMCRFPGRCQIVRVLPNLRFFIDGAHTQESAAACSVWFSQIISNEPESIPLRKGLLFNCSPERSPFHLIEPLIPASNQPAFDIALSCPFNTDRICINEPKSFRELCLEQAREYEHINVSSDSPKGWQRTQLQVFRMLDRRISSASCQVMSSARTSIERLHRWALLEPSSRHIVLITGSLYLVGAVLEALAHPPK